MENARPHIGAVAGTPVTGQARSGSPRSAWICCQIRQGGGPVKLGHAFKDPLARETGLEPATSGVTGRRSNQLSYSRFSGREALGREPTCVKR